MDERVIDSPTVGQFREFLAAFDQNAPLRIMDADTDWTISKIHVTVGLQPTAEIVWLYGEYSEML